MLATVDAELKRVGSEARQQLVESLPATLELIQALAAGIVVEVGRKVDGQFVQVVYRVPPFWPAIKYLSDWGRKIVGTDPAERKEVGLTQETMDFIREGIKAQGPSRPQLPAPRDGVVILGDFREVSDG